MIPARPSLLVPAALAVACGSTNEGRPSAAPTDAFRDVTSVSAPVDFGSDDRDQVAVGACDTGAVQECRIYLPAHNGVQPCFVGEQYCVEGTWTNCLDPDLVDANDGDSLLSMDDMISAGGEEISGLRSADPTSSDEADQEDPAVTDPPEGWADPAFTDDTN